MFVFGEKLLRAYVIYYVYVPNQNKAFLSYFKGDNSAEKIT